jgi:hypothetical protein
VAASAKPKVAPSTEQAAQASERRAQAGTTPARRAARIVRLDGKPLDDNEIERRRLLQRLIDSEGRSAISRAADDYKNAGFDFPHEQDVHLQLLAHFNETLAGQAIEALTDIVSREVVKKRPVLDQRLRRLEEYADEGTIREAAAALRRRIRG